VRLLLMAAIVSLISVSASADPLYSTGFLDPTAHGPFGPGFWFGSDTLDNETPGKAGFTLANGANLTGVEMWTYDTFDGSRAYFQEIGYQIASDPSFRSDSLLASGIGTITSITDLMDHRSFGSDSNLFTICTTFNLETPITLAAGTTYWLSLVGRTDPSGVSNNARWANAATSSGGALSLEGVAVPEPNLWTLLLLGCGALAWQVGPFRSLRSRSVRTARAFDCRSQWISR